MGKAQKKTGKGRLDKYYKLAKEQGYRARSAFKLIQLNKKYSFLESAKCCIDLCAAPGGWLQVAAKYMPVNSLIVGVDLVPIRSIPRVSTFAADITTPLCRSLLRGELKDWKADVVLHDGAPNVGSAWVQDAFSQAELVLMSLKLAVEFLMKGGTFVTKVFRSADYNNLLWIFNQLFKHVEATKPPSSRNVSAEIFVVCRDFLAPKHLDPKFLDPKYAFREVQATESGKVIASNAQANVFMPEKKRRNRDGYDEGDYTLFRSLSADDFVKKGDSISMLGTFNRITFNSEEERGWLSFDITNTEIKACCEDLKVLGKREFKSLLKWRSSLRELLGVDAPSAEIDEEPLAQVQPLSEDPDTVLEQNVLAMQAEQQSQKKRDRRKANQKKARSLQRMQLQMTAPMDIGMEQADAALGDGQEDLFNIGQAFGASGSHLKNRSSTRGTLDELDEIDSSSEAETDRGSDDSTASDLGAQLDALYGEFKSRRAETDAKFRVREGRKQNKMREEAWGGISSSKSDDLDSEEESEGGWDAVEAQKARRDKDDIHSDSDSDSGPVGSDYSGHSGHSRISSRRMQTQPSAFSSATRQWFEQGIFTDVTEEGRSIRERPSRMRADLQGKFPKESIPIELEELPQEDLWDQLGVDQDAVKQDKVKDYGLTTAEAITMAQALVNRRTTKSQLLDDGFNRHSFRDQSDLPSWFLDDESKHYKSNIPVTKEAIAALRAKQRALDARPIKKIAEAKARKKFKTAQRLAKATKKAEGINESTDLSERDKAAQIQKLMALGGAKNHLGGNNRPKAKVVVAKGVHRGVKGRPKGVKGKYLMVDARMRKEQRVKKRIAKESKKRK